MTTLESTNPYSEDKNWKKFSLLNRENIDVIIKDSHNAFLSWKDTPVSEKKLLFLSLADTLENDLEDCSRLQTIEMWMLYSQSKAWMLGTVNLIRWFANNFEEILKSREFESEWIKWREMYDPLGVIFWIAPRNFPFNQLLRAAVPNILAGNTQIYKHSSSVPMCAQKIQDLFDKAWFPKGVYTNLFVSSKDSEYIISNKFVAWINLTGSEWAWSSVGSLAWKYLKPSVLELGGNDAFLVCDTNNLEDVVNMATQWRNRNGWQACNCSKRFIVPEKYYDEFCEKYIEAFKKLKPWNPMDEDTTLQPLSSISALEEVEEQIQKAIKSWAKLLYWWKRLDIKWYFISPTVLWDVTPSVSSFDEEIFAPVASIIKSSNLEESVSLANNSQFWLSAVVVWDDLEQLKSVSEKVEWWMIFINQIAWSKASLPFGWVKKSWYGKENGPEWLKAFTNKKVILYP